MHRPRDRNFLDNLLAGSVYSIPRACSKRLPIKIQVCSACSTFVGGNMLARLASRCLLLFTILVAVSGISYAQFTGNIQGTVQDPSGAAVAQAKLVLQNSATQVSATTTSDSSGNYKFLSLAPGS